MDDFYEQFAKKTSIPDSNCLVLAFSRDETNNGNVKLCKFLLSTYYEVSALWVYPRCAYTHNCLDPTLGRQ